MTVLYITQNGVTDHIGQSQIGPYVLGLARSGFGMHVLSAEKDGRKDLIASYARAFANAGVKWTRVRYRNVPRFVGQALTQRRLRQAACSIVKKENIALVHCRSHPAALIGQQLRNLNGLPYLFDFRDFYADGGMITTKGLSRFLYARLKRAERRLVREAAGVVCLTNAAREILSQSYLSHTSPVDVPPFQVIPCCADFAHFDADHVEQGKKARLRQEIGAATSRNVLIYVGSIGPDYLLLEMLRLFLEYKKLRSDAKFLFVVNNGHNDICESARACGVNLEDIIIVSASRDDIPALISLAQLSVIFCRPGLSKAGCSPTKLAELFAMNVPVIANTGVGDLGEILTLDRNGSVAVCDFRPETLRRAIMSVIAAREDGIDIRSNNRQFDVAVGVQLYASIYRRILSAKQC
jgi:glycosyltransferase involved in cell wall biosynthesis